MNAWLTPARPVIRKSLSNHKRFSRLTRAISGIEPLESRILLSSYVVTSTADDGSSGTLRWAVNQTDNDTSPDTITFASNVTGTINVTNGYLEFSGADTTVQGPGSGALTISGGGMNTVFRVDVGVTVGISGLTIADGNDGVGAGINNSGTTTVTDCTLSGNDVGGGVGGAIYNSAGTLSVFDSTFSGNTAANGGAIDSNSGSVSVQGCTFSDNVVTQDGGAIEADFATLDVVNSTFAGNSAGDSGGAIESNAATTTITNTTISANNAVNGGGGIDIQPGGDTSLYNTIVSGNTLADMVTPSDVSGPIDESLQSGQSGSTNNLIGVSNIGLGALANNGGPTETMALLPGSPAIDAGDTALALDVNGNPLTTDQRGAGFARVIGAAVDIGAFEAPLPAPAVSAFSGLTAPVTITAGTASVTVGGVISAGSVFPGSGEVVAITLNGVTQDATIGSTGVFSTTFNTSALPASATAYQVTYSYAGDTKLSDASNSSTTTVTVKAPTTAGKATLSVGPVSGTAGDKVTLSATLLGAGSAPLAHQLIVFTLNGKVVAKEETNCKGVACAKVRLHGIAPGIYASGVVASYAGNKTYGAVTATAALTVADSAIEARGICLSLCNGKAELLAEFAQAGDFALATDYTVTINWGDGSKPDTGKVLGPGWCCDVFGVQDSHTYAASKTKTTYTVTVTITSKYGATTTLTEKVKC